MQLDRYPLLTQTIHILQAQQLEAYLVGGAVRDLLLGRDKIVDLDFVVPQDGLKVARRVADALGAAFYPLDAERDTGRVVYESSTGAGPTYLDFASFRGPDLAADLADRDFTINGIALSLTGRPQLIDPLNGQEDLQKRRIRMASVLAFQHDPVRILRAVRQAVEFGFEIEVETEQGLRQATSLLKRVSPERQRDELLKLLNTPAPGEAVHWLQHLGVLARLLPEVEAMGGVTQSAPHHLDVFQHTRVALNVWARLARGDGFGLPEELERKVEGYLQQKLAGNLSQANLIPFALLFHDTGKPLTRTEETTEDKVRIRFLGHERESAKIVRRTMNRLHFSLQAISFVETTIAQHMRPLLLATSGRASRRAIFRFFRDTSGRGCQAGVAVALHALADHQGTYPPGEGQAEERALRGVIEQLLTAYFEQHEQVVEPPLLLTGNDLVNSLGLAPGKLVGTLLARLKEAQATGQVSDREAALAFIKGDADFAASRAKGL